MQALYQLSYVPDFYKSFIKLSPDKNPGITIVVILPQRSSPLATTPADPPQFLASNRSISAH